MFTIVSCLSFTIKQMIEYQTMIQNFLHVFYSVFSIYNFILPYVINLKGSLFLIYYYYHHYFTFRLLVNVQIWWFTRIPLHLWIAIISDVYRLYSWWMTCIITKIELWSGMQAGSWGFYSVPIFNLWYSNICRLPHLLWIGFKVVIYEPEKKNKISK